AVPPSFVIDATTEQESVAAIRHTQREQYGIPFHPEVENTEYGVQILKQFLFSICHCDGKWSMEQFVDSEVEHIREIVGDRKVLCALSVGVDSSVVAVLIHKAIGDQLTCIFVDHGLLRKNEASDVMELFAGDFHMNIIKVDAQERFLSKLEGVSDPEKKRKIIGNE